LLMRKLFVHNSISHDKREQWPTLPYSHPEGSYVCHSMYAFNTELGAVRREPP
jgi:hypothetical protein